MIIACARDERFIPQNLEDLWEETYGYIGNTISFGTSIYFQDEFHYTRDKHITLIQAKKSNHLCQIYENSTDIIAIYYLSGKMYYDLNEYIRTLKNIAFL